MKTGNRKKWEVFTASVSTSSLLGILSSQTPHWVYTVRDAQLQSLFILLLSRNPFKRGESISTAKAGPIWGGTMPAPLVCLQLAAPVASVSARVLTSAQGEQCSEAGGWSLSLSCGFEMRFPSLSITQWRNHCHCQICSWIGVLGNCGLAMRVWRPGSLLGLWMRWMCFWLPQPTSMHHPLSLSQALALLSQITFVLFRKIFLSYFLLNSLLSPAPLRPHIHKSDGS